MISYVMWPTNMLAKSLWYILALSCLIIHPDEAEAEPESGRGVELVLAQPYVYEQSQYCGAEDGCLQLTVTEETGGTDSLGEYYQLHNYYTTSLGTSLILSSRLYGDGTQVFRQEFPDGLEGTSTGDKNLVSTCYPRFTLPDPTTSPDLRYITPGGYMVGWTLYSQGLMSDELEWFRDGEDGGLVVLFQGGGGGSGGPVESVVLSPVTQPMATNVRLDRENYTLDFGVQGQAESIYPGYSSEVILNPGSQGITKNIMAWGESVKTLVGTVKRDDPSARYLSYYTDNGAAHYYNPLPYTNFRDAIMSVYNQSVLNDIPIRRLQLDSWWYHKGEGSGVKNWTEIFAILPGGIAGLHESTGWPIVAHNRYFSSDTDYAQQNGGPYMFTMDEEQQKSLPLERVFWEDLFDDALLWGLDTYEQDWLDRQYMFTSALHTNLTLGETWLDDMGSTADERGLNIQYCMSFIRHLLHSTRLPAVTQIRVSDDYILCPHQWRIGVTSLLAHVLGLRPYKDVFWSSSINTGVIFNDCELDVPDIEHPWSIIHQYGGKTNVSASGKPCVPWRYFGWDELYFGNGMYDNFCRNPANLRDGAFCYTKASFELPEEEWEWEYCDVPLCNFDCYLFNGLVYLGDHNITQSGRLCVDWAGDYNITGAKCRNPDNDEAPWCYVTEDHSERDYCNNKCQEAVEHNPHLQSAVATLSGGPLGVGDKAENLNINLIMKSCNAEGLLLHPTKPLTVVDGYFWSTDYQELWTGYSTISNYDFGIIFLAEIDKELTMTPADLNLENAFMSISTRVFSNYPAGFSYLQTVVPGQEMLLPSCSGHLSFCLLYTSPALQTSEGDVYILGELDKWTPVSPDRITSIMTLSSTVTLAVEGVAGESVSIAFSGQTDFNITCNFLTTGTMTIDTNTRSCF
ncbi:hypothetical protein Pmani_018263 [Petrolisthes manimaculis]|uniref:Kringle domain-containing protein n=1 Tax=Petrolisthes manimaculis TaxID=1843537 RepID=A0AAE1PMU0_9EUCA|nr:hypothetical protein Pmani_018263 [Petrolisthes manimaculis]